MSDSEIAAGVKVALKFLAEKMNEASERGITVDVCINPTYAIGGKRHFIDCSKIYRKREHIENF